MFRMQAVFMKRPIQHEADLPKPEGAKPRRLRADAQRKKGSLIEAATKVFATSGVDAPIREIAAKAGVGLGTVYRHFPQRSDLIAAVMQTQVDACADAASALEKEYEPGEALRRWLHRFMDFLGTKRGLAAALHSGDPAYSALPGYFIERMHAALGQLLDRAVAARAVRAGIEANHLLLAVGTLCHGPNGDEPMYAREMVDLLIDGLRYGASPPVDTR